MQYTEISDQMFFKRYCKIWGEEAKWERHSPAGQEDSSGGKKERERRISTKGGHERNETY